MFLEVMGDVESGDETSSVAAAASLIIEEHPSNKTHTQHE
ncbi:hypothetical protein PROFUN_01080 [Planoprotostelium fungivorum]|uniref:Uncharacterized protein n=1 Tax=Planoprotostelium fungivorum TaxID=1890364 RepID=A0A2P6NCB7_9EUKA|nr:hypothetical protein PROFUN_01080 [Planoprotostelium fungivorum]